MSGQGPVGRPAERDPLRDTYENRSTAPADGRTSQGSTVMLGQLNQELARQKHREDYIRSRRLRLMRAARAERRARRAVEVAVRAQERVHVELIAVRS